MMTVEQFIRWYIGTWEGGLSVNPDDHGNYWKGKLVGSKYGVTAAAIHDYNGNDDITADTIKNMTMDVAVDIGVKLFYKNPRLSLLPWNAVTASVLDKCWGSGPRTAIKLLQGLIGDNPDGVIGDKTVQSYQNWLTHNGESQSAIIWAKTRKNFDLSLHQPQFLKGWDNRTDSFLPDTKFWDLFHQ